MPQNDPKSRRWFLKQASVATVGAAAAVGLGNGVAAAQAAGGRGNARSGRDVADLVLHNGRVQTMQPGAPVANAIAIKDGVVLQVGSMGDIGPSIGRHTELVNLKGSTVLPGMHDTHVHAVPWATQRPPYTLDVGYPTVRSIADIVDMVAGAVQQLPPGEWIRGSGWDQAYFAEGRAPSRHDLDAVSPDNPVRLVDWSAHAVWVNTKALEVSGVTRDTVPPPGGEIVKDADGEPTGLFYEAGSLVPAPGFGFTTGVEALKLAASELHAEGVTGFTDVFVSPAMVAAYTDLSNEGTLRQRVVAMLNGGRSVAGLQNTLDSLPGSDADPRWFKPSQVKLNADGVPTMNKTAWLYDEYVGGGTGGLVVDGDTPEEQVAELHEMILRAHQAGLQIGTHATGDRAIDVVVDGYIAAMNSDGRHDARHYVIHGDLSTPSALSKMAAHGIGISMNATIKWTATDFMTFSLGRERANYQWPYRSALDAGVMVTSASDAPITAPNFRQGIETMMLRQGRQSGETFGAEQRIGLQEAIATHTRMAAWQDKAEDHRGTLTPGMVGDVTIVEGDIQRLPADEIAEVPVQMTVVGGEVVFDEARASDRRIRDRRRNLSWVKRQRPGHAQQHCCGGHDHD